MTNTAKPTTTTDSSISIAEPLWFSLVSTRGAAETKKCVWSWEKKSSVAFLPRWVMKGPFNRFTIPKSRFTNELRIIYESPFTESRFQGWFIFCAIKHKVSSTLDPKPANQFKSPGKIGFLNQTMIYAGRVPETIIRERHGTLWTGMINVGKRDRFKSIRRGVGVIGNRQYCRHEGHLVCWR